MQFSKQVLSLVFLDSIETLILVVFEIMLVVLQFLSLRNLENFPKKHDFWKILKKSKQQHTYFCLCAKFVVVAKKEMI